MDKLNNEKIKEEIKERIQNMYKKKSRYDTNPLRKKKKKNNQQTNK